MTGNPQAEFLQIPVSLHGIGCRKFPPGNRNNFYPMEGILFSGTINRSASSIGLSGKIQRDPKVGFSDFIPNLLSAI